MVRIGRREFLKTVATIVAGGSLSTMAARGKERRPNVVIIFTDDLGYGDLSCYGGKVPTPNIDSIRKEGLRFTDGYVSAPVCSPSRAGLVTGRYQQRFGHEFNAGAAERCHTQSLGLPTSEITFANILKSAGYITGMVGKSHLGSQEQFLPTNRGFDEYFGFLHGANTYTDPPEGPGIQYFGTKKRRGTNSSETNQRQGHRAIFRGTEAVKETEYLTDAFAREAADFIERHSKEQLLLYVAFNAVHTPLQVTDKYYDRFRHIKTKPLRIYAAMISALDDGVRTILKKLREKNIEKETIVFFLSDNGAVQRIGSNGLLNAGKLYPFEGGLRIPFMVKWPGRIPSGRDYSKPVISLDIFSTIAKLTGARIPKDRPIDGVDLMPYLTGDKKGAPHEILFWRNGTNLAVRKGKWKYVCLNRKRSFLFDLEKDIGETKDLSKEHPEVFKELEKALENWESQMVEPLWPSRETVNIDLSKLGLGEGSYELFI